MRWIYKSAEGEGGGGVTKALKVGNQIVHMYLKSNTVRHTLCGLAVCVNMSVHHVPCSYVATPCPYTMCLDLTYLLK